MPIISIRVVKNPRISRRCENCYKRISGETIRLYGMAEIGDKPYAVFVHRGCLASRDALAKLRDAEQAVGAVKASHTEDSVVNVGQAQDEQ